MPASHAGEYTGLCPAPDSLLAYASGRLPSGDVEAIGAHVSDCPKCQQRLSELAPVEDSLGPLLRQCVGDSWQHEYSFVLADPAQPAAHHGYTATVQAWTRLPGSTGPADLAQQTEEGRRIGSLLGPYRLLEQVGHGGMGVVYRARDEALGRTVALKLVRLSVGAAVAQRFRAEAEAAARLEQANIVRVYAFGEQDGEPYLAMEYLRGGSLTQRQGGKPLPAGEAASLLRALAEAVAFAHANQVLHRDLKPDNVLFAADGTAKLTDFGLAKLLDADTGQTPTDGIMGTVGYVAPELARGNAKTADATADVYGLGAVLYEMLTGRPPFKGGTRLATLDLVCNREPTPPSRYHPGLCRDLEAVCLKCLEKQPGDRYPSASALADDLGRWQRGEPTVARPLGRLARLGRSMRRHKTAVAAVLLGFLTCGAAALALRPADPDTELRRIEADLRQGKAVELIGETGAPRWFNWRFGGERSGTSLNSEGTFVVHSWSIVSLLELVRDPQMDRYRLRADVQHISTDEFTEVGLYFCHVEHQTDGAPVHLYWIYAFNDIIDAVERWRQLPVFPPPVRPVPRPEGNAAMLTAKVIVPKKRWRNDTHLAWRWHSDPSRLRPGGLIDDQAPTDG